jgi:hypothetical protein
MFNEHLQLKAVPDLSNLFLTVAVFGFFFSWILIILKLTNALTE